MKFKNLLVEMTRLELTQKKLAETIGMRPETLSRKMLGKTEFTLGEINKIRDSINPELKLEYLFAIEEKA